MELQWPLIIFTTLVAWSAGLFATQCLCAIKGEAKKAQMIAWIVSAVLLVVGGIAVFFHLEHWERIFNGFGHLSSGITQELIAIVVLAVVAVIYLLLMRKSEDGASVPAWLAGVGIAVAAVLLFVMAHSYMMAARPAWDTFVWILVIFGNACAFGPLTMLLLAAYKGESVEGTLLAKVSFIGAAVNVAATLVYVIAAALATGSLVGYTYYFDHVDPMSALMTAGQFGPFASGIVVYTLVSILAAGAAAVFAFLGPKKDWKWWVPVSVACVLVGAVLIRVAFYLMGASVFMLF